MKNLKRVFALLLALVTIGGMSFVPAFAENKTDGHDHAEECCEGSLTRNVSCPTHGSGYMQLYHTYNNYLGPTTNYCWMVQSREVWRCWANVGTPNICSYYADLVVDLVPGPSHYYELGCGYDPIYGYYFYYICTNFNTHTNKICGHQP